MAYKILVVDDEAHYADMLRDLLLQSNFIADMVNSVQQAIDALDSNEYALIIADFKMPGMDGAEFLQRVRLRNAAIPFFMVSGLMNTHELIRVANLGVTLVFEKPLEIGDFMECVKRYVTPLSDSEFQRKFRSDISGENYPAEVVHLSDKSPLGRDFVQRLWTTFRRERIAITPMLPGAELEFVAREISHWKGRSQAEFYTVTPDIIADPDSIAALNAVVDEPSVSTVLIINGLEDAEEAHLATLAEFIRGRHTLPSLHQELFFLIIPDASDNCASLQSRHPALGAMIKAKRITLPPLRERPADIAKYARNRLSHYAKQAGDMSKAWIDADALGLLLQHRWKGEYAELDAKMKDIVHTEREGALHTGAFAAMLENETVLPEHGYTLGHRLKSAQEECVALAMDINGGDRLSALLTLGVHPEIAENLPQGELAYPELLK